MATITAPPSHVPRTRLIRLSGEMAPRRSSLAFCAAPNPSASTRARASSTRGTHTSSGPDSPPRVTRRNAPAPAAGRTSAEVMSDAAATTAPSTSSPAAVARTTEVFLAGCLRTRPNQPAPNAPPPIASAMMLNGAEASFPVGGPPATTSAAMIASTIAAETPTEIPTPHQFGRMTRAPLTLHSEAPTAPIVRKRSRAG
ncbi:MAG: hypothetical protein JNL21_20030 [Myxococcales bacterium]|nr:hypothetical protein [Myxococcales bacterium]